jgi:hypothetical protein
MTGKQVSRAFKNRDARPSSTFAEQLTAAFDEKLKSDSGASTLAHLIAINLWQRVLRGEKHAVRNWERLRKLAGEFDVKSPIVIKIRGGLPDEDSSK